MHLKFYFLLRRLFLYSFKIKIKGIKRTAYGYQVKTLLCTKDIIILKLNAKESSHIAYQKLIRKRKKD